MDPISVVILAAGLGKRLGIDTPKVLVKTRKNPLIIHVLEVANGVSPQKIVIVTGHKRESVESCALEALPRIGITPKVIEFAYQEVQRGTGDAVKCALPNLSGFIGTVLILCGDVPLVTRETLLRLLSIHHSEKATISLLSFFAENSSSSLGRIIRDPSGRFVEKIKEAKDCTPEERGILEVNAAIYAVDSAFLKVAVERLKNNNVQGEYYLTDIVEHAVKEGQRVSAILHHDPKELEGVNTLVDLSDINLELNKRKVHSLLFNGVEILDPSSCYVDDSVVIGKGSKIGPNVRLIGDTKIGSNVTIEGTAYIKDSKIDEGSEIRLGVRSEGATIGTKCIVGPFAHLRPGTVLDSDVKVGNFVEIKNSRLSSHAKASHLTYLGDSEVGEDANIGAGTITCNYDGVKKSKTIIGKGAFIGSNSSLVAPVNIGDGAIVGAGSVITKDVSPDSLAVARGSQIQKDGWAKKRAKSRH